MILGRKEDAYALSSETTAFPNLDYHKVRDLGPGEIVRVSPDSVEVLKAPGEEMQICSFLWVYYGFPTSCYENRNVEDVRFASGYAMGSEDDADVDCVCGIPDSGVGMALGYAAGKGVPYRRAISKYTPTWPRSFTPPNQEMRNLVAKMKLVPNKAMLEGQRALFCDDSIVRGTTSKKIISLLRKNGAKEIHMLVGSPIVGHPCYFGVDMQTREELVGGKITKDDICKKIGADSLNYIPLECLKTACGGGGFCAACFDGNYPDSVTDDETGKFIFE